MQIIITFNTVKIPITLKLKNYYLVYINIKIILIFAMNFNNFNCIGEGE